MKVNYFGDQFCDSALHLPFCSSCSPADAQPYLYLNRWGCDCGGCRCTPRSRLAPSSISLDILAPYSSVDSFHSASMTYPAVCGPCGTRSRDRRTACILGQCSRRRLVGLSSSFSAFTTHTASAHPHTQPSLNNPLYVLYDAPIKLSLSTPASAVQPCNVPMFRYFPGQQSDPV
jgi:hypothetical protein